MTNEDTVDYTKTFLRVNSIGYIGELKDNGEYDVMIDGTMIQLNNDHIERTSLTRAISNWAVDTAKKADNAWLVVDSKHMYVEVRIDELKNGYTVR